MGGLCCGGQSFTDGASLGDGLCEFEIFLCKEKLHGMSVRIKNSVPSKVCSRGAMELSHLGVW